MGDKDTKGQETSERDSVLEVGTSDLLDCPCCGKRAEDTPRIGKSGFVNYIVYCIFCNLQTGPESHPVKAKEVWNRRAN